MGYSRKRLNHLETIKLFDSTHMISVIDIIAIGLDTPIINSEYSLEKEFTEFMSYG